MAANKVNLSVMSVYQQAWRCVKGTKAPIWITGLMAVIVISLVMAIANHSFGLPVGSKPPVWYETTFLPLLVSIIMAPFLGGINAIAINRARGKTIGPFSGFKYFDRTTRLVVASLFALVIANVLPMIFMKHGTLVVGALHVVSFLFSIFLLFMIPFIVDKNLGLWSAFKSSVALVARHYGWVLLNYALFALFILAISFGYLHLVEWNKNFSGFAVVLLLAMIWLLPLGVLMLGVIYTRLVE